MKHFLLCLAIAGLLLSTKTVSAQPVQPDKTFTNPLGMTFIRVEPGTFQMGSPETEKGRDRNEKRHTVRIQKAFFLQETEVTLKQWWTLMGKNWFLKRKGPDNQPVTRVSFYDCERFIRKLNEDQTRGRYRFPTEKEWEYACRAGSTTAFFFGDDIDCTQAMFANSSKMGDCKKAYKAMGLEPGCPAPVKSFPPNAWGFYDMHGNVWEWCSDPYWDYQNPPEGESYDVVSTDHRIRRGGSWYKYPKSLRSANRAYAHPGSKFKTTGFRLVFEATP